jgi:magnesium-transporting ATPase (P-type)
MTLPVTINEMLLRGCMLKNSGFVLGMVVYAGPETRIQMNSAQSPLKYGARQFADEF